MFSLIMLFTLTSASLQISTIPYLELNSTLSTAVGSNCGASNVYEMYGVNVNPWPPNAGMHSLMIIEGIFIQNALVQNIVLGTCYNSKTWNYDSIAVDNTYSAGEEVVFELATIFPTNPGNYISNVQLQVGGAYVCCWQFPYTIS
ncbi:hypothetical protein SteCoe_5994 [Stentor coeruleus]|uniref:MD-2-related lipid-recognition domain-containing protein n=1 Tax=Stentor coeruleus TaxID=5963 RepID=A0A1R2CQZ7_9CILI|nr:hypothetical protein SteCoe_33962 [Stentor coeruleus]OMJ91415.1 hypothetical protein SteCoe_5994 [Stentor coeruleus]